MRSRPALAVLLWAAAAAAAGGEAPSLTIGEALTFAREHQPLLRRAQAEVATRRLEARVPRYAWLPRVGATAQLFGGTANNTTALTLNVPGVDLARIGGTGAREPSATPYASTLVAFSVNQTIYDFGRWAAQAAAADALVDVASASAEAARLDVELGVEESFHAVLASRQVLAATAEAVRRAQSHRDLAEATTRTGLRPPIELTRAAADLAKLEVLRGRAASGLRLARAQLAQAIGSDALEVDARDSPAGADPQTPAFDEALRRAAARNPAIVAALARVRAQVSATRAAGRELAPNVFASGTLSARAGGSPQGMAPQIYGEGWLPSVVNFHLGVIMEWRVDPMAMARLDVARAREEVARADVAVVRLGVTLAVERAALELEEAERGLPALLTAIAAARANLDQAEARFKAGLGTVVELADAEALLHNAEVELAIERFTVARARARLGRAVGGAESGPPR